MGARSENSGDKLRFCRDLEIKESTMASALHIWSWDSLGIQRLDNVLYTKARNSSKPKGIVKVRGHWPICSLGIAQRVKKHWKKEKQMECVIFAVVF